MDGMIHNTSMSQPYVLFFNRGGTKGINSSKILCSMFVYVLFHVNLCTGLILCFLKLICGLMTCVQSKQETD